MYCQIILTHKVLFSQQKKYRCWYFFCFSSVASTGDLTLHSSKDCWNIFFPESIQMLIHQWLSSIDTNDIHAFAWNFDHRSDNLVQHVYLQQVKYSVKLLKVSNCGLASSWNYRSYQANSLQACTIKQLWVWTVQIISFRDQKNWWVMHGAIPIKRATTLQKAL